MKLAKQIILSALISGVVMISVLWATGMFKNEGYVDGVRLHNEFELKIKLQKKLEEQIRLKRDIIDSLNLQMNVLYSNNDISPDDRYVEVRKLQNYIDEKTYEFAQYEEGLKEDYNTQIWTQLNEYLKQYGEEEEIDILWGATGQGTILYAEEKYDLTTSCVEFVNKKYRGE